MYLSFYNKNYVGDVLLLLKKEISEEIATERNKNVVRIFNKNTNETVAFNIFNISESISLKETGQVFLTNDQQRKVNEILQDALFEKIEINSKPQFVVGYVEECIEHPDSDHLHITQVDVGTERLQIVCGASNVAKGQYVVVAKVGAVMPNGMLITSGSLRNVESNGMLCSSRELGLTKDTTKKGILVLDHGVIGENFTIGSIY